MPFDFFLAVVAVIGLALSVIFYMACVFSRFFTR